MPNPDLPCSLLQSIPLPAMRAGFGPGEASACIPSCWVQLPRRNAGPRGRWHGTESQLPAKKMFISAPAFKLRQCDA